MKSPLLKINPMKTSLLTVLLLAMLAAIGTMPGAEASKS